MPKKAKIKEMRDSMAKAKRKSPPPRTREQRRVDADEADDGVYCPTCGQELPADHDAGSASTSRKQH